MLDYGPRTQALLERVAELEAQLEALRAQVLNLTHKLYGRRSEQSSPAKGAGDDAQELPSPGRRGQQPGTKGHGRARYLDLPAREVIHELPEADRHCPRCGLPYPPFPGDEVFRTN
jgi:transposase